MGAAEADRTLFVGNLDPRATEELLFELFLQAGPAISVKIPKDKDGKPKQFAFVNFKHEESAPYGMSLLNGIKLFGRPLKIQYRSGSKHISQDNATHLSPQGNGNGWSANSSPSSTNGSRYEDNGDLKSPGYSPTQSLQRSFSSPDNPNLQRQAVMNSFWQQSQYSTPNQMSAQLSYTASSQQYYEYNQSSSHSTPRRYDAAAAAPVPAPRNSRSLSSHPYRSESHHYSRESRYQGSPEERSYDDRSHLNRSYDYDPRREGRYRSSRH
ncbi:RNA-binding protein 7 [Bombina bombina]|uniref:RNA-binding protein 7 n=1 Tax=Bombina bombina TaxID=8345 RepID=UPI00235B0EC6|nr:RNA-binding protein 7 [Bombina bombina]